MLDDLPSYANRVIQRARRRDRSLDLFSYVLLAGKPEFEPLPLTQNQYQPILKDAAKQVFFTTLERQYDDNKAVTMQHYHWLFLTQTTNGWRLAMVFSQLASLGKGDPPLPPQETSDGVVGQAVDLWLRDCRAGTLRN